MSFDELVTSGWNSHESDPEGTFARARHAAAQVETPEQAAQLARLLFHVGAEHLDRPDTTLQALREAQRAGKAAAGTPAAMSLARMLAACHLCAGDHDSAEHELATAGSPTAIDHGMAEAMAAGVHATQGHIQAARELLRSAVARAEQGGNAKDDLARVLAVTGNNMAAELEEEHDLDDGAAELMVEAAKVGRRYWEISGNWMNVERAEYRLASAYCRLNRGQEALEHARQCLAVCEQNQADAGELFFANEILARAHAASAAPSTAREHCEAAAKLVSEIEDSGFRSYCEETLQKLRAQIG